jgi:hypothetical protein
MPALSIDEKLRSPLAAIARWWRDRAAISSARRELRCCAEDDLTRIASDAGVSVAELHQLVSRGPQADAPLLRRMALLDLDRNEVSQIEPRTFQDLQKNCTLCKTRRRCARDLERNPANPDWQSYCPNAATLLALDALPWASRREW